MSTAWRRILPTSLLLILLLISLLKVAQVLATINQVTADLARLQTVMENDPARLIDPGQRDAADALLQQSARDWRELRSVSAGLALLGPLFGWVPRYGGTLRQSAALLDFGDALIASAQDTLTLGRELNVGSGEPASGEFPGVRALLAAQSYPSQIQQARVDVADAARRRAQIDAAALTPSLIKMMSQFDRLLPIWQAGLEGLALAPTLLGVDRPRDYLVLAQNSDELRPTGGFITGVVLVRIDRGQVTVGEFQDSYAIDNRTRLHPTPPAALREYMEAGSWYLRDSNWSPDFPTAARVAENLYAIDRGLVVDGVIVINPPVLTRLLDALGPVTVPTYGQQVNSQNVMTRMQEFWATPHNVGLSDDRWAHRKDFIGQMLDAIVQRLRSGNIDTARVARAIYDSVQAKDVLVYLNDVDAAEQAAWPGSGALYQGPGDALMIVDSNVGWNKVDSNVVRQAEYAVTWNEAGQPQASLTITYTNLSAPTGAPCVHEPTFPQTYPEMQQGCYWDYLRVVVPQGSQLKPSPDSFAVVSEAYQEPRTKFAALVVVPRGESQTVHVDYALPPSNDLAHYTLHLERQPGAPPIPLHVTIMPPSGWVVSSASNAMVNSSHLEEDLVLDHDQVIQVAFEDSTKNMVIGALLFVFLLVVAGVAGSMRIARTRRERAVPR